MSMQNHNSDDRRVVVTGMGIVTTIGQNLCEFKDSLMAGRSGITRWKKMDERILSKVGGDMNDFDFETHLARTDAHYPPEIIRQAKKLLRVTPLSGQLAIAAGLQAYFQSGLADSKLDPERFAHVLGGSNLNLRYAHENHNTLLEEPEYIDPLFGLIFLDTDVLAVTSELLGAKGPSFSIGGACASGSFGLIAGLDLLRSGRADAVLVTGAAQAMSPLALQGWGIMDAISYHSFNDAPTLASRPFDARREGFVPSEGSGAVILEPLSRARERGAPIYAELLGGAAVSDASRNAKAHVDGEARAMRVALHDAQINPEAIDYINAHAASTPLGDATEVAAIKTVFGDHAYRIPINSTKSMVGHCTTAAGVVEFVATVLEMNHDFLHPTINQEEKDPELDLDFVPNTAREYKIQTAISNSFGLGGLNASVVVGHAP